MIYKIFRASEWQDLQMNAVTHGAPVDVADGFIHFSTAETVRETGRIHFAGEDDLWLAAVDEAALGDDLKWEESRGGVAFPHLYRPLYLSDIVTCEPLPRGEDGALVFPDGIA